jgi:hypothetical protein
MTDGRRCTDRQAPPDVIRLNNEVAKHPDNHVYIALIFAGMDAQANELAGAIGGHADWNVLL